MQRIERKNLFIIATRNVECGVQIIIITLFGFKLFFLASRHRLKQLQLFSCTTGAYYCIIFNDTHRIPRMNEMILCYKTLWVLCVRSPNVIAMDQMTDKSHINSNRPIILNFEHTFD